MNAAQRADGERGRREVMAWRERTLDTDDGSILLDVLGIDSLMTLLAAYLEGWHPRSPRAVEHIDKLNREIAARREPAPRERCVCGAEPAAECWCWA